MKLPDPAAYIPSAPAQWVKRLFQIGLTAKGVLYCLLGVLALAAALELCRGTREISRKEVYLLIEELFLSSILLLLVSTSLACYCRCLLLPRESLIP